MESWMNSYSCLCLYLLAITKATPSPCGSSFSFLIFLARLLLLIYTLTPLLPNTSSSARSRLLSPLRCYSCGSNVGYIDFIGVLIPPMEFSASKVSSIAFVAERKVTCRSHGIVSSLAKSLWQKNNPSIDLQQLSRTHLLKVKVGFSGEGLRVLRGQPNFIISRKSQTVCLSTRTQRTEEKDCSNLPCAQIGEEDRHLIMPGKILHSRLGLAEACRYVHNDAKYVNERARNDIILLSRGIMQLDARARKGVAILGSEFLKLDARAREDTGKIDRDVKEKAARLHHIAMIIKDRAQSRLKSAADKHWSDGALNADLRRADFRAKQRAMEDALMALEFIKNIHDLMVSKMYKLPLHRENGSLSGNDMLEGLMLEKNGRTSEFFPGVVSADRINAIQEAYCSMASALSEADGIDYTDPEELELLIATLIDLDAMDGKSSVSLLAECSSSPDVNTRQALANALAAAPSMWTLGNAGMGALQRLSEDTNPAIAAAASRAIYELKKQWEIEEGDSWRFMMNQIPAKEVDNQEDRNDPNTK